MVKLTVRVYKVTGMTEAEYEGTDEGMCLEHAIREAQTLFEPKDPDCRFIAIVAYPKSPTKLGGLTSLESERKREQKPSRENPL